MAVERTRVTVEEYERLISLPENAERRFELIDGEMIEKMPTQLHALIVHLLNGFLFVFVREHPIGWVLPEARYALPDDPDNTVIPDLSFVVSEGKTLIEEGAAPYMPDLAIEVQSPGQSDKFMADKARYYLTHGSKMVWLVYPKKQIVEVLTADDRRLLTPGDTLSGGDLLPGFTLPVVDIFPKP